MRFDILRMSCAIGLAWMLPVDIKSDSGMDLASLVNKPLPKPILTQIYDTIWRHENTLSLPGRASRGGYLWFQILDYVVPS